MSTAAVSPINDGADHMTRLTVATLFNPRNNALNLIRMVLATVVIVWHSFPLTGHDIGLAPLRQIMGHIGADGFFAISGYQILGSWRRKPQWWPYLKARVLRIFPAYWVNLLFTAGVLAPLAVLVGGGAVGGRLLRGGLDYVVSNSVLWVSQYDIVGTPTGIPYPSVWNGSMWTLVWQFLCYLAVLALGVVGLLRWRASVPVIAVVTFGVYLVTVYGPLDPPLIATAAPFALSFVAGALLQDLQHRLPVTPWLVGVAGALVAIGSLLPDYRIVAAFPLAYLLITLGGYGKHRHLKIKNDLCYGMYVYAFPIQQTIAVISGDPLPVWMFVTISMIITLPVATGSLVAIERPVMRLRDLGMRRPAQVEQAGHAADHDAGAALVPSSPPRKLEGS